MKVYILKGYYRTVGYTQDHDPINEDAEESLARQINETLATLDSQNVVQILIDLPTLRCSIIDQGRPGNIQVPNFGIKRGQA